jgi:hypothetical protein
MTATKAVTAHANKSETTVMQLILLERLDRRLSGLK